MEIVAIVSGEAHEKPSADQSANRRAAIEPKAVTRIDPCRGSARMRPASGSRTAARPSSDWMKRPSSRRSRPVSPMRTLKAADRRASRCSAASGKSETTVDFEREFE